MSKKQTPDDRLRGIYRNYLQKVTSTRDGSKIDFHTCMTVFDLAIQKNKLTTLEDELSRELHPVKESKIGVSGDVCEVCEKVCELKLTAAIRGLTKLASYVEGVEVDNSFDEPKSAAYAREVLKEILNISK